LTKKPPADHADWAALAQALEARRARTDSGGGPARLARHERLGRLGARARLAALVDEGSFVELGREVLHRAPPGDSPALDANRHPGDGLVCGLARVDGQDVAVVAHDPTVLRGALGHAASQKLCRLYDLAHRRALPVVSIADCDGVRVEEGTLAIDAYGEVIRRIVRLRGRAPQLTLVAGLCVGAAAYAAALSDLVAMVRGQSFLFITGPKVTKVATGEEVDLEALGGPALHAQKTGACHAVVDDERAGIAWLRRALAALRHRAPATAATAATDAPAADDVTRATPEVAAIVPTAERRAYDMRTLVDAVVDRGSLLWLAPDFARNLVTGLARLGGRAIAVVASQPLHLAGCLDVDASLKGARFVRFADARRLPIVTFVDVPGYLPGRKQEEGGILVHGKELLDAYGAATVPLTSVVVRKSYGGASVLSFAADVRLGLPTARVAPMGIDATVEVALGPPTPDEDPAQRREREAAFRARHDHPFAAAESGYLDQIVAPADLRRVLAATVFALDNNFAERP
jgi:propionyl-CoA carboxylase beta chain